MSQSAPIFVVLLVLLAALLHAVWNAIVKGANDPTLTLGLVALGHGFYGLVLVLIYPLPSPETFTTLLISTVFHYLYYFSLNQAYRYGDLSIVYPLARGIVPPLVSLGGFLFADEVLSTTTWLGVTMCSLGFLLIARTRNKLKSGKLKDDKIKNEDLKDKQILPSGHSIFFALLTGVIITAYSILDGLGGRSTDPLIFVGWLFLLETPVFFLVAIQKRRILSKTPKLIYLKGIVGGLIAGTAYALVIYAKSIAPLGIVSTLRETGVIFATLIGIIFLREKPWKLRLVASAIVFSGVVMISYAGSVG